MLLNWQIIAEVFEGVIQGRLSLEDANDWARKIMEGNDVGTLMFEPKKDEPDLWEAAMYLCSIDMLVASDEYLHSTEQVKQEYERRWKQTSASSASRM